MKSSCELNTYIALFIAPWHILPHKVLGELPNQPFDNC